MLTLLLVLSETTVPISTSNTIATSPIMLSINPEFSSVRIGEEFQISIYIADVETPGLYGYEFKLHYAKLLLKVTRTEYPSGHFLDEEPKFEIPIEINREIGYIHFSVIFVEDRPGKTGSGVLATVQFKGLAAGNTTLELKDIILVDPDLQEIQYQAKSGNVNIASSFLAEIYVNPQYRSVAVGESFSISVNIANVASPGLYVYDLWLHYDKNVLQGGKATIPSNHFLAPSLPVNLYVGECKIYQNEGYVHIFVTLLGGESGKTGDGVLATVQFRCLAAGNTMLEPRNNTLLDPSGNEIQFQVRSGNVNIAVPQKTPQCVSIADYFVPINEFTTVEVTVENASTIAGGSFDLCFDKSIVNAVSVSSGDFGVPAYVIDNSASTVRVSVAVAMAIGKGTATLAKATFRGLDLGFTLLQLQNVELNDEKDKLVSLTTKDGSIAVGQLIKGDLNRNGRLDTGDATLVLRMVVGLNPPDMVGDINGNGRIDTGDDTLILRKLVGLP